MYAKDYEHKENKTNEGNDIYLLFCIVIQTCRNMEQRKWFINELFGFFNFE